MEIVLGCLGVIAGAVAVLVLGALWRGFVLVKLWTWFILPVFPTFPTLSMAQMFGLALMVSALTGSGNVDPDPDDENEKNKRNVARIANVFLAPLICLSIGWLVKAYWL